MNARLGTLAQADLIDYAVWYTTRSPITGRRFLLAIEEFRASLSRTPRLYERVPRPPRGREVRQGMIPGFPFIAVYEILPNEIVIIDISHASLRRRPWRGRL
jgi:plasmid stabilization system protein ParE